MHPPTLGHKNSHGRDAPGGGSLLPGALEKTLMSQQAISQTTERVESWLAALEALDVRFLVVDAQKDRELLQAARSHPKWTVDLEDKGSVLFTRAAA
jgi:hypothetical protein